MQMTGEQTIAAPRQKVWAALNDPEILRQSIPGCQSLEQDGEGRLKAVVAVKIGPIGARFAGAVTLSDLDPPNGYTITGEGQGGMAGSAKGGAKVRLADAPGGTLLSYNVEAEVGGRMAQLGGPMIDATAKQLAGKFFEQYRYTPPPMTFTSAAHACIVEVDAETGFVKIKRWLSCEDCGTIINPAVVEGQIAGGLAQGIGMVLLEEMPFDARGNPEATTFKDYMLPQISDVPDFEYLHACTPSQSVGGIRGVGEGGAIIGPPTLVNAIADALAPFGDIPYDLPLTPVKLLEVIEGRSLAPRHAEAPPPAPTPAAPAPQTVPEPPAEAATPDGLWKMVLSTPMGPQEMKGRFETSGATLTGELMSPEGAQGFSGTVEGNRLLFDLKVEKPMKITLKYDITISGDKLSGKVKMGFFGNAKLTGERL